jgi:lysophospholipase L1-like esterase
MTAPAMPLADGIVIDGDSISSGGFTAGWPPYPAILQARTAARVANRAGFGRSLSQCVSCFEENIAPYSGEAYPWLIILAGINDLLNEGEDDLGLIAGMHTYCTRARETGFKVAVGSLLPARIGANRFDPLKERYRRAFNACLASSWREFSDGFIDFSAVVRDVNDPLELGDGLHPNGPTKQAMADLVARSFMLAPRQPSGDARLGLISDSSAALSGDGLTMTTGFAPALSISRHPLTRDIYFEACFDFTSPGGNPFVGLIAKGGADARSDIADTGVIAFQDGTISSVGSLVRDANSRSMLIGVAVHLSGPSDGYAWFTFDGAEWFGNTPNPFTIEHVEARLGGIPLRTLMANGPLHAATGCSDTGTHMITTNLGNTAFGYAVPAGYSGMDAQ